MALIPTRVHAVYDYVSGAALIAIPLLAAGTYRGPAVWVPVVIGVLALGMSLMTRYELGAVRVLPMPAHLGMDMLAGLLLAASPWLFRFADVIAWPHVVAGLAEIGLAAVTARTPSLIGTNTGGMAGSVRTVPDVR
ncbi:MAG: hypothetical protein JWO31_569 [Phycisphaerales bacterium]|nr:hypothetical protein [Phycisphaerales bacterium]